MIEIQGVSVWDCLSVCLRQFVYASLCVFWLSLIEFFLFMCGPLTGELIEMTYAIARHNGQKKGSRWGKDVRDVDEGNNVCGKGKS